LSAAIPLRTVVGVTKYFLALFRHYLRQRCR